MSRPAPSLPISPKMFRHFAIITVAFTACVAMFADGEGREAIAAQIEERQQKNALLIADAQKAGKRTIGLDKVKVGKGAVAFANASVEESDTGSDYGAPMETPDGSDSGGGGNPFSTGPRGPQSGPMGQGPTTAGPPFARNNGPGRAQPPRPNQAQLDRIMEESRRRSGASE